MYNLVLVLLILEYIFPGKCPLTLKPQYITSATWILSQRRSSVGSWELLLSLLLTTTIADENPSTWLRYWHQDISKCKSDIMLMMYTWYDRVNNPVSLDDFHFFLFLFLPTIFLLFIRSYSYLEPCTLNAGMLHIMSLSSFIVRYFTRVLFI